MDEHPDALALRVEGLQHAHDNTPIHWPDLRLARGSSCAIVGPSGSGKSTLMHLVAGLLTPSQGRIHVAGQRMDNSTQRARDRLRGRCIGMVLQQLRLVRSLSALDNLLLAQRLAGRRPDPDAAAAALDTLGLAHRANHRPAALSQGEAQRVAIARALLGEPALILADEPTSALDDRNAGQVLDLLLGQAKAHNAALLVVTHDARIRGRLEQEIQLAAVTQ